MAHVHVLLPLVFVCQWYSLESEPPGVNAPYVGERSVESGRILGRMVVEKLGGADAKGTVVIGICFPGFPVLENRAKGVQESLKAAPGLNVLGPFDVKVSEVENYLKIGYDAGAWKVWARDGTVTTFTAAGYQRIG